MFAYSKSTMEVTPKYFQYATSKLQVARNKFKIVPTSSVSGGPYSVLQFSIPQGTIVDLQSLKLYLNIATASPNGSGGASDIVFARLPGDIASMIQQVQVMANGVLIGGSCNEYNSAYRLRKICAGSNDRDQSIDRAVSHSDIISEDDNESGHFVMKDWLHTLFAGGKEGASTRFLDTSLVGDITVRIQFAGNQVLVPKQTGVAMGTNFSSADARANASRISWSFSDAFATIDAVSMPQAYTDMMLKAVLAGGLSLDYEEAYNWSLQNITGDAFENRFSVSTRSLNKIYTGVRDSSYNTTGIRPALLDNAVGSAIVSNYLRFRAYPGATYDNQLWNYNLNGQQHPNYPAQLLEACGDTSYVEDKVGVSGKGNLVTSYESWLDGVGLFPLRLDLPRPDDGLPDAVNSSGFDCRSTNASMSFAMRGMSTPTADPATGETAVRSAITMAVTQPTLFIQAGKSVSVSW